MLFVAANPNNRWNAFLDELFRRYNDTIPHAVKAVEYLLQSIIVSCIFGIICSIMSFTFIPFLVGSSYSILCYGIIKSGIMKGVNEDQIKAAIEGDMFAIQEVNIELVLTWIENVMIANGRANTLEKWIPKITIVLNTSMIVGSLISLIIKLVL